MWLFTTLFLLAVPARAEERKVILFGGTGSQEGEMRSWAQRATRKCGNTHKFVAVESPIGADPDIGDTLRGVKKRPANKKLLDDVVKTYVTEIVKNPRTKYVIAGHSSAGSLAKVVAYQVMLCQKRQPGCPVDDLPESYSDKAKDNVELKLLDGGQTSLPDFDAVKKHFKTECWAEEAGFFPDKLKASCGAERFKTFKSKGCKTKYCRHYSTLNHTPPKNLRSFAGYDGDHKDQWEPNLDWVGGGCGSTPAANDEGTLSSDAKP